MVTKMNRQFSHKQSGQFDCHKFNMFVANQPADVIKSEEVILRTISQGFMRYLNHLKYVLSQILHVNGFIKRAHIQPIQQNLNIRICVFFPVSVLINFLQILDMFIELFFCNVFGRFLILQLSEIFGGSFLAVARMLRMRVFGSLHFCH